MRRWMERLFGPVVLLAFASVLLVGLRTNAAHGIELHGAGATFPAPLYARWIALFERAHPGIVIDYRSVGSGAGIEAITARDVHFGASDALLSADEREALPAELVQIPVALGPVVLAYNLPDLPAQLTLNSALIAAIYLGQITRWNDPAIQSLNPELTLSDRPIRVAHRADSSGTTAIFTDYLSAVSSEWAAQIGRGKRVDWPVSAGAGEGNDGVAQQILLQTGGIGYLELTYAQNAGLEYAALVNQAGARVLPTIASVQAAEENTPAVDATAHTAIAKPSIVNAPGQASYPIAGFTYLLVYADLGYLGDAYAAEALVEYLRWTLTSGQETASTLHYTPLPASLREQALDLVARIRISHE